MDLLESVPFRRFSPSLLLLCKPPPVSPSSQYYVVIGLSFEPCDALLQIKLRFSPLPSSLSTPRSSQSRVPELPRNQFCSNEESLPPILTASLTPTSRILPLPLKKHIRFPNWTRSCARDRSRRHDASSLLTGSHYPALTRPPPAHQLFQLQQLPHSGAKHPIKSQKSIPAWLFRSSLAVHRRYGKWLEGRSPTHAPAPAHPQ